tara:strand:+ start:106 stop:243 length:138 start_codon:yes stop_codon:yes gene_type:complete
MGVNWDKWLTYTIIAAIVVLLVVQAIGGSIGLGWPARLPGRVGGI